MRSIGYVIIVTLTFQFFFVLFNVFKYLIPLKVKSPFMSIFYVLAGILTLGRIVEVLIFVLPMNPKMNITGEGGLAQEISSDIASIVNVWIGSLFVATMYQISQSLKRI